MNVACERCWRSSLAKPAQAFKKRCLRFGIQRSSSVAESFRPSWGSEDGSSTLELAFVLPLYVLLVFGFINAALLFFVYSSITYASRAATRHAAVRSVATSTPCSQTDINTIVQATVPFLNGGQLTSPATWTAGNTVGGTVTVNVRVVYAAGLPLLTNSSLTLSSTSVATIIH